MAAAECGRGEVKLAELAAILQGHKWWNAEIRFDRPLTVRQQRVAAKAATGFAGWDPFLVGRDGVLVRSGRWPGEHEARTLLTFPARLGTYRFRVQAECGPEEEDLHPCACCIIGGRRDVPWVRVDRLSVTVP